jgi:hypothetical protein
VVPRVAWSSFYLSFLHHATRPAGLIFFDLITNTTVESANHVDYEHKYMVYLLHSIIWMFCYSFATELKMEIGQWLKKCLVM